MTFEEDGNDWEGLNDYLFSILDEFIDDCYQDSDDDREHLMSMWTRDLVNGNDIEQASMMDVPREKVEEFIKDVDRINEFYQE